MRWVEVEQASDCEPESLDLTREKSKIKQNITSHAFEWQGGKKKKRKRKKRKKEAWVTCFYGWLAQTIAKHIFYFFVIATWYPLYFIKKKRKWGSERVVLQVHLFHLLPNRLNPFTSSRKNPLASVDTYMMGNFTLSPCYVSSPLTQEVTFLSCSDKAETISLN